MADQCEGEQIPVTCSKAFGDIKGSLARMDAKLDAVHEQTTQTNGHVGELFRVAGTHGQRIQALEQTEKTRSAWGVRVWKVLAAAGLVAFGMWLKS